MWNEGPSNVEGKVGHRECRDRVHIEWGEKGEISQEQLFGNSCDSKINKTKIKAKILKETDIFINEDYCKDTAEYIKELWEEVKLLRSQGKIAY